MKVISICLIIIILFEDSKIVYKQQLVINTGFKKWNTIKNG